MAHSKESIISKAAVKLGDAPINGDDGSDAWIIGDTFYDDCYETLLAFREWTFARGNLYFNKLTTVSVVGYKYVYQIPNEVLSISDLNTNADYKIIQGKLHTNLDNPLVSCNIKPDESQLPSYFVNAFVNILAAEMCIPLVESASLEDKLLRMSSRLVSQAVSMDLAQEPMSTFTNSSIMNARYS